jgi:hypothetical protein
MPSTDDILAAIDSAVDDWTVGPDAVKVLPPGVTPPEDHGGFARGGWPMGEVRVSLRIDFQPAMAAFAALTAQLARAGEVVVREFGKFAGRQQDTFHLAAVQMWAKPVRRKHRARCHSCNRRGNPRPLPINGNEYRRRTRRRNRNG